MSGSRLRPVLVSSWRHCRRDPRGSTVHAAIPSNGSRLLTSDQRPRHQLRWAQVRALGGHADKPATSSMALTSHRPTAKPRDPARTSSALIPAGRLPQVGQSQCQTRSGPDRQSALWLAEPTNTRQSRHAVAARRADRTAYRWASAPAAPGRPTVGTGHGHPSHRGLGTTPDVGPQRTGRPYRHRAPRRTPMDLATILSAVVVLLVLVSAYILFRGVPSFERQPGERRPARRR